MDECQICRRPRSAHLAGKFRHAFVGLNESPSLREDDRPHESGDSDRPASQGPVRNTMGGDPILRMALIRAGVITIEDLEAVEKELRGAGIAVAETMGQSRGR
jgi:hypothetical protein